MQDQIQPPNWQDRLSVRLLAITIGVILFIELLIFIPSAINFRDNWLDERLQAARIAVLALEVSPDRRVSEELSRELLDNAEVISVMKIDEERRELILAPIEAAGGGTVIFHRSTESWFSRLRHTMSLFFSSDPMLMRVDSEADTGQSTIEVIIPEAPLSRELRRFSGRIFWLSLLISILAGGLVYLVLDILVVRPMRGVTKSIVQFRNDPSAVQTEREPTTRKDEIGRAQNALADMEAVVSDSFRQRERLAQLGEAVAKINHDLRNSLAAAQLVSEGLARSEDPRVQRAAPRLERALERGIKLAQETLQYGKSTPPKPNFQYANLRQIADEAAHEALSGFPDINWQNTIATDAACEIDPDHLHRIISNLVRNAAAATAKTRPEDGVITISLEEKTLMIADNGPGLPEKTRDNLFVPFASSDTKGGTGLGLVIARDLSLAMGGDLKLGSTGKSGTSFHIELP